MATNTYVALDKVTVGTATSTIAFSSIPQGYTDLVLVVDAITTTGDGAAYFNFNADTGSNYSATYMFGDGSTASSGRISNATRGDSAYLNTTRSTNIINIQNYSNSTTFKTWISRFSPSTQFAGAYTGLWRSTAAITSFNFIGSGITFAAGSTFSLYGIAAVPFAAKATGGTITYSAGYWYHAFTSSGTFAPTQALTCDALVIAGGGGGSAGGGGAGGLRYFASESLGVANHTVTIGGGGGSGTEFLNGGNGNDSQLGSLTISTGGGGGGDLDGATGNNGGSGGGGGNSNSAGFAGGSASPSGQGNAGGSGFSRADGDGGGGGGGGAGGSGVAATVSAAGNGGAGTNTYSTFASATSTGVSGFYAGGGGGGSNVASRGTGGSGGGGNGYKFTPATAGSAGTANTGSGGGGNYTFSASYPGGSGIVIIRYAN